MEEIKVAFWEEYIWWPIWRKWDWLTRVPNRIKYFVQRGRHGYADCDLWSLDDYLAEWLPDALRDLAMRGCGCRSDLFDQTRKGDECWRWREILMDMARGFEAHTSLGNLEFLDKDDKIDKNTMKELEQKADKGLTLFKDYFGNLWD